LLDGIEPRAEKLALDSFAQTGLHGDFLKLKETRLLFRKEQHFPSPVIDRGADSNVPNIISRAHQRANELLESYQRPEISAATQEALLAIALRETKGLRFGHLPGIELTVPTSQFDCHPEQAAFAQRRT